MIKEELALALSWGWKNQSSSSVFSLESRFLETSFGGWTSGEPGLALSLSLRDNTGPSCSMVVGEEGGAGCVLRKRINKFPLTNLDHSILVSRPLHLLFPSVSQTLTELMLSVCAAAPFSASGSIPTAPTRGPPRRHFLAPSSYPLLFPPLGLVTLFYPISRSHLPPSEITLLECNYLSPRPQNVIIALKVGVSLVLCSFSIIWDNT